MKLHHVPPRQGFQWVRGAFRMLRRQPLGFAGLFTTSFLALMVVGLLPVINLMMFATLPAIAMLFMIATRRAIDDLPVLPGTFIEFGRAGRVRLLGLFKLGLACGVAMIAVLWIGDLVDGGALESLPQANGSAEEMATRLADPALQAGALTRFGLMALLSIPAWHAPALVYWGGQPWGRALVFSTFAWWRNKGAFLVYIVTWMSVSVLMMSALGVLANLLPSQIGATVMIPLLLAFWTAVGASLYFTFADCFDPDQANAVPAAA